MNTSQDVKAIELSTLLIVGGHKTGPQATKITIEKTEWKNGENRNPKNTKSVIFSHQPTVFALMLQIT